MGFAFFAIIGLTCFQHRAVPLENQSVDLPYRALLIGINRYQHFNDLTGPEGEITRLWKVLENRYGFAHVETLFNENATEKNLEQALKRFFQSAGEKENLLLYFAGHGLWQEGETGYWVPHDGKPNETASFISNVSVLDKMKRCRAKHILLVSDSCFSGSFFNRNKPVSGKASVQEYFRHHSRWVISSGYLTEVDDQYQRKNNSPFFEYLIDLLQTNEEPYLSPPKIADHVWNMMSQENLRQKPIAAGVEDAGHRIGSFLFYNKNAMRADGSPYPPPWQAQVEDFLSKALRSLQDRRVTVRGYRPGLCQQLEELGFEVTCETDRRSRLRRQIHSDCSEISRQALITLAQHLGLEHYDVITATPEKNDDRECGQLYEITIRN